MKPTALEDITRVGDLGGTRHQMTFDANSIAHIMSILTDLYSDPLMAIVREYCTNAWDSHQEAGQSKPIEVSTPSVFSPQFVIKDFGVGLSAEDIENIYSKYGASTKRDTNTQTGMLGLGCKSALTYTAQFMLVGIKDGIRTFVSISRNEDGTGVMEVIDSSATDQPNGVEISIPIQSKDFQKITTKANHFLRFWPKGTALVNSVDQAGIIGVGDIKIGDRSYLVEDDNLSGDFIVMGNVAYPCERNLYPNNSYNRNFSIVSYVDVGQVNFTPSREALHYTGLTERTIAQIIQDVSRNIGPAIEMDIALCETHAEAARKRADWERRVSPNRSLNLKYKGLEIPLFHRFTEAESFHPHRTRGAVGKVAMLYQSDLGRTAFVTGFDADNITTTTRSKVKLWIQNLQINASQVLFVDNVPAAPWTDEVPRISFDDLKALKIPRAPAGTAPKKESRFDIMDNGWFGKTVKESAIDKTKPVFFISGAEQPSSWSTLTPLLPDGTIVKINKNRWDRFKKLFPNAKHINDYIDEEVAKAFDALAFADKVGIAVEWHSRSLLKSFDHTKINDPVLKAAVQSVQGVNTSDAHKTFLRWIKIAQQFTRGYPSVKVSDPLKDYPLLGSRSDCYKPHAYVYINTIYEMSTKETK